MHRLLVVATFVLALLFVLPGCFTLSIWSELPPDRERHVPLGAERGQLEASTLTVALSPEVHAALAERWSAVPTSARGLRVSTVALPASATERWRTLGHVAVFVDADGESVLRVDGRSWPATIEFLAEPVVPSPPGVMVGLAVTYRQRAPGYAGEVVKRVLCTPATLLLDVVTSPVQILTLPIWLPDLL